MASALAYTSEQRVDSQSVRQPLSQDDFRAALLLGDLDRCQAMIDASAAADEVVLAQGRLDLAQRRYFDVIERLSVANLSPELDPQRKMLLGAAFGLTFDFDTALSMLNRAIDQVSTNQEGVREEALYYKALVAWTAKDHREAEAGAHVLLESSGYNDRAHAHALLAWVAQRRFDIPKQLHHLQAALDEFDRAGQPDQMMRGTILVSLLALCRELPLPAETERAGAAYDAIPWTNNLATPYFLATRYFGWIEALRGDSLAAFRWLRKASQCVPSEDWKVVAQLDRAYLAKCTGEEAFAQELVYDAHTAAERINWDVGSEEQHTAYALFAELFSAVDPELAYRYLALAGTLVPSEVPGQERRDEPRARAIADYSTAVAYLRLGQSDEAQRLLVDAWAVFEDFKYGWRAALCALRLFELTGEDEWLDRARSRMAAWPECWIAPEIAAASQSKVQGLSERHWQVLELMLQGKSNPQISEALERNMHTVRNQVAELFVIFGVNTRAQLVSVLSREPMAARNTAASSRRELPASLSRRAGT